MRSFVLWFCLLPLAAFGQQQGFDCNNSAPHRQFDFWLGEWAVHNGAGELGGHNRITAVQQGCVLEEQWRSVRGGTGQSLNYYDPGGGQWRQLWLDAGASIIDIRGGLEDGSMVLEGSIYYLASGSQKPFRGTWTPLADGRVRQFFQEQDDDGNWQTWFEGFYTRRGQDDDGN
ncbi:hypothetical protein DWB85_08555 [Seongchinamella sediminis]|uniref:Uncharacterized protein n=1 Tax=Seongchinamella sediminis TaxID=2283635 RepID=A0A3L7E0J8_9GAMM|nr:hypothetical protein [Seongchinamella sediminis]RLQ22320.1 hypothetical protein DWB85_08555 [Seongchinamella sediminis]